ncbi:odorant receptor 43a isoform X2 [Solenopsis invicta]|uniref:odorant receptor 43a isoform X2 n=1 Tax=Solenopsis invicta TaxID=13686 RepID=UPI00193CC992|nr:odorant receptor 43a isoform X2 [Solenopsis invicta]
MIILRNGVAIIALVFDMNVIKHSGYKDFVWAVEINRIGLELIGLWPNETIKNTFVSDLRMGMIFFIVTFLSIIPLLCSLIRVWGNMILVVDNLQVTLPLLVVSLKIIIMRWNRTAIALFVKMMAEDWMELKIDAERKIMIRRAQTARLVVICGYILMIFVFIVLIILPSFGLHFRYVTNETDQKRLLPFQSYYFYDTDKSPQFEFALVIQATTMFLGAITYTSVDAFLGLVILHICGQLENFKHRLVNLTSCKDFDSALRNNVRTHQRIIRFANNIEDTFTLMMLGLVFYFGIVFCLFGFLLVTVIAGDEIGRMSLTRVCFLMIGIFTLVAHTFLYCGAGEIIAKQSEAVYRAMCNLKWYKLEPRKEKNLILLMMRANEPFYITAGKIFPLTMTTFCSLLKTSAGYISFLLASHQIES